MGARLQMIESGVDISGGGANFRREVTVSVLETMRLTLIQDQGSREVAGIMGAHRFDVASAVLDRTSEVIYEVFMNDSPRDCRLEPVKTVGIWAYAGNAFLPAQ